jgi:hypothetical protein
MTGPYLKSSFPLGLSAQSALHRFVGLGGAGCGAAGCALRRTQPQLAAGAGRFRMPRHSADSVAGFPSLLGNNEHRLPGAPAWLTVAWPDKAFVDGIHMEASYVARFTERFRICKNAAQAQTGPFMPCDLRWASVSGSGEAHR